MDFAISLVGNILCAWIPSLLTADIQIRAAPIKHPVTLTSMCAGLMRALLCLHLHAR